MDSQTILSWLLSEAGAGWAAALLVLVVALVGWIIAWRRRERPACVIVQEIESIKLLDIHRSQRDKLTVSYSYEDGMEIPVQDLRQKKIVIYNNGSRDILDPLEVELRVVRAGSDEVPFRGFWQWFSEDKRFTSTVLEEEVSEQVGKTLVRGLLWRGVRIELPYLNSYPVHRDYVAAHIVCDGEIEMALWGKESGRGWSAEFIPLHRVEDLRSRISNMVGWSFLWASLASITLLTFGTAMVLIAPQLRWLGYCGAALAFMVALSLAPHMKITRSIVSRYLRIRWPAEFNLPKQEG